jgi:hypothetical protein
MRLLLLGLLIVLSAICCTKSGSGKNQVPSLMLGSWQMVSVENLQTGVIIKKDTSDINEYCSVASGCEVILQLSKSNSEYEIGGHTISNQLYGDFSTKSNNGITLNVGATKLGDANWSDYLIQNSSSIKTYRLSADSLHLYFHDGKERLNFIRMQ